MGNVAELPLSGVDRVLRRPLVAALLADPLDDDNARATGNRRDFSRLAEAPETRWAGALAVGHRGEA